MSTHHRPFDISNELCISRYRNGVKLIPPSETLSPHYTVGSLRKLPFNTYFLQPDSVIAHINEQTAETMGFISLDSGIGKTVFDVTSEELAFPIIQVDRQVIKNNCLKIVEELILRNDGVEYIFVSTKAPLYDNQNKVTGIFGCSILLNGQRQPMVESLAHITKMGLLNGAALLINENNNLLLTSRQKDCLYYLAKGMTAKEIAAKLSLSSRTVEHYLEAVKVKLQCSSRSELIDKAFELGIV